MSYRKCNPINDIQKINITKKKKKNNIFFIFEILKSFLKIKKCDQQYVYYTVMYLLYFFLDWHKKNFQC